MAQVLYEMTSVTTKDLSNGYEAAATEFIASRSHSNVGVEVVRNWAKALPSGATVLDLGCGHGVPISQALIDEGFGLYGIDASPTMIAAFRSRFPRVLVECGAAEDSDFFGRIFDGVLAWGLMFLLEPRAQANLIHKVAASLKPGSLFLFTAPQRPCEWTDIITGNKSVSLGRDGYLMALRASGLALASEADDEGENHYFFVHKPNGDGRAI